MISTLALLLIAYAGEQTIAIENIGFVAGGTQMTRIIDRDQGVVCYVASPTTFGRESKTPGISCVKLDKK